MARGRMIKPELWTSRRINSVSLEANLLFIALLNFCDDFGVIPDSNRMILGNCFPFRSDVTEKNIDKWKVELIDIGLIAKIVQDQKQLLAIVKWEKHQTIMNRSKRNYIDNDLTIQQVIETIERLISVSLGSNYPIDNRKETIEKRKETKTSGDKSPNKMINDLEKPDDVTQKSWDDWMLIKKGKNQIMTTSALEKFIILAKDYGFTTQGLIDYCIIKSWASATKKYLENDGYKPVESQEEQLIFEVAK